MKDAYSSENQQPLTYFSNTVAEEGAVPVISSDIGIEGVTAVTYPDIPQTFLAWQAGDWAKAYQCYAPALTCVDSWEKALSGYQGKFIVLGQTSVEGEPVDVADLSARSDVEEVSTRTFYRPYERTWFTIEVMEKK